MQKVKDYTLSCEAAVDRETGIIYFNPTLFHRLTHFEKKFVMLHEEGHYMLQTTDEVKCDAYAFDRLAGTELRSLKKSIATLDKLLRNGNPTRANRLFALYKRALKWDAARGNELAAQELKHIRKKSSMSYIHSGEPGWSYVCEQVSSGLWGWKKTNECRWKYDSQKAAQELAILAEAESKKKLTDAQVDTVETKNDNEEEKQESDNKNLQLVVIAIAALYIFS